LPFLTCFPRYQPSPKSSSRSINSTISPFDKVSSSELRAEKSSSEVNVSTEHHIRNTMRDNSSGICRIHLRLSSIEDVVRSHLRITMRCCPISGLGCTGLSCDWTGWFAAIVLDAHFLRRSPGPALTHKRNICRDMLV
jgi:hypothetical protein